MLRTIIALIGLTILPLQVVARRSPIGGNVA
jgi:hypothetical protein